MKTGVILGVVAVMLLGCSSSNNAPQARQTASRAALPVAAGPINNACLSSNRTARSRQLCGCIQAVANQSLTSSQQQRAAAFYANPQQAQVVRQSDRPSDERFWTVYRAYGERAEQVCR